jgi:two-component system, chemotaxis family, CheB/CheR fusion protein
MTNDHVDFEHLLAYLKRTRGFDFSAYKPASLQRRVKKRMQMLDQATYAQYLDYLEVHPAEFGHLFNVILINVTDFFRDPPAWEVLERDVLPQIVASKKPHENIRVWVAGCASGQEAYSMSMLLAEVLGTEAFVQRVKIYATDVDEEALSEARAAAYTATQVNSVPAPLLAKYFDEVNGRFVFNAELRRTVIFGRHDLLQDAPISRVDLLSCRNTLMYFNAEAQARIISKFDFALNRDGYLFLGKAEVLITRNAAFQPVDMRRRLFMKVGGHLARERQLALADAAGAPLQALTYEERRMREQAVEVDPVAQVVLDLNGSLAVVNAQARLLLGLTADDVGQRLQDLQIYRPVDLRYMIEQVVAERRALHLKEVEWNVPGMDRRYLDVAALPLIDPLDGAPLGVKVVLNDVSRYRHLQEELHLSQQALETTNQELQTANAELETTNEELQSTVEELETTNEELQSTNEELETMNEELQSTNEELEATNQELRQRTDELNGVNVFLQSIMAGLRDGVVVLDRSLQVRAWNHGAEDLWGLRDHEVRGQHFFGLDIGLPVEQLKPLVRSGLRELADGDVTEPQTLEAINRRGKPIQVRVSAAPLRSPEQQVQGVILIMEEVRGPDGQAAPPGAAAGEDGQT